MIRKREKAVMEEMSYGDHGGIRDAKGIKSELMPAASSLLVSKQVPQSDGENFSNMCHPNGKKVRNNNIFYN